MVKNRISLEREKKTILVMLRMYCHDHHASTGDQLCQDCRQLHEYALVRIDKCPFGADKGPCSACEIHCYKPEMRRRVRDVMRYAGPRMLRKHPVLAINHLLKKWKRKPTS
ncbi:MAG: nitrous oxide-stimulated promoter family protein [Phycisphaerales bacterium]|nr:MAG: nitrous oxide-stimulated promoter family protein [Phycisphaerales bacterium]